ncbi:MAG TPA: hypothetical protein VKY80_06210 [Croceibacterium sp.]|nr:hypothetical protein [Croceibacterium sp.]
MTIEPALRYLRPPTKQWDGSGESRIGVLNMKLSKLLASSAVAASLITAPVAAQAAAADMRASANVEGESLAGGGFLIPALAILAIVLGIVVAVDDGDDAPVSP